MSADVRILGQQRRPLDSRLSRDHSIEGIARPLVGQCGADDVMKRSFAELQSHRLPEFAYNVDGGHSHPVDLEQVLKLELNNR